VLLGIEVSIFADDTWAFDTMLLGPFFFLTRVCMQVPEWINQEMTQYEITTKVEWLSV